MKKLIALFFLISFNAHSQDHQNKTSTFIEKHNGIVWVINESLTDYKDYIAFYNQPERVYSWRTNSKGVLQFCDSIVFGKTLDEGGPTFTIVENNPNHLLISLKELAEKGLAARLMYTMSENGKQLKVQAPFLSTNETYIRTESLNPCLQKMN